MAKISDFGTVRVNREQDINVLRTSKKTHASTGQVCGTGTWGARSAVQCTALASPPDSRSRMF